MSEITIQTSKGQERNQNINNKYKVHHQSTQKIRSELWYYKNISDFFLSLETIFVMVYHFINYRGLTVSWFHVHLLWLVRVYEKGTESTKRLLIDHWPLALCFTPPVRHTRLLGLPGTGHRQTLCLKPVPAMMIAHTAWWLWCESWLWLQLWAGFRPAGRNTGRHLSPACANVSDFFRASFWRGNLPFK